ncbi:hypothetical protein [Sagittula salina]|uniref:Uncharacterized protein n=1 Tax=Sagittula salina TaxID=2820268 RepID=A0A940MMI1_9RHOB|nr:hypothetical protein [Sagittula salina]MBP0481477.1 hypothetical protein [Sagittula salina]
MSQPRKRVGLYSLLIFAGMIGGAVLYDELRPRGGPSPDLEARLRCVARTVALQQATHATGNGAADVSGDVSGDAVAFRDVDALTNEVFAYVHRMQQSDDPARLHYRPIMMEEEQARDTAMASDPGGYMRSAWAEAQSCAEALGLRRRT